MSIQSDDKPGGENLDLTVLSFAQWLSELRSRTNGSLQQVLAEMNLVRNGLTAASGELTDLRRHSSHVSGQQQTQLGELREAVSRLEGEVSALKKAKNQTDQEMAADYQSLAEQLNFKHLELDSLKKSTHQNQQQLQAQVAQLQTDLHEVRLAREDTHRMAAGCHENLLGKTSELELSTQQANTELRRIRVDHEQAIANLADNMSRWNDTIRDLSREFHEFQKLISSNQNKLQGALEGVQKTLGPPVTVQPTMGGGGSNGPAVSTPGSVGGANIMQHHNLHQGRVVARPPQPVFTQRVAYH